MLALQYSVQGPGGIRQVVTLTRGASYQLSFYAKYRQAYPTTTLQVAIEGVTVFGPRTLASTFVQYSVTFQVACGTYETKTSEVEFDFQSAGPTGDSVMLDL
eukprot:826949-Rhodomonas_salina.1